MHFINNTKEQQKATNKLFDPALCLWKSYRVENLCLMFRFLENYLWWFHDNVVWFYDDSWWFMMLYPLPLSHYIFTHGFETFLKVLLLKLLTSAPINIHHWSRQFENNWNHRRSNNLSSWAFEPFAATALLSSTPSPICSEKIISLQIYFIKSIS